MPSSCCRIAGLFRLAGALTTTHHHAPAQQDHMLAACNSHKIWSGNYCSCDCSRTASTAASCSTVLLPMQRHTLLSVELTW